MNYEDHVPAELSDIAAGITSADHDRATATKNEFVLAADDGVSPSGHGPLVMIAHDLEGDLY